MEFWIIMIIFICMGGSCSLTNTWWNKIKKKSMLIKNRSVIL